MKKFMYTSALFCLSLFFLSSCDKGNDAKTKTELLTQASWHFSSARAGGVDITSSVDDCYKDNIITFNSTGGNGTVDESANVCSSSTAGPFTWSFQNGETELSVSNTLFPGGTGNIMVVSLNETTLVVSQDMTIPPYPTTNVEVTLVH